MNQALHGEPALRCLDVCLQTTPRGVKPVAQLRCQDNNLLITSKLLREDESIFRTPGFLEVVVLVAPLVPAPRTLAHVLLDLSLLRAMDPPRPALEYGAWMSHAARPGTFP